MNMPSISKKILDVFLFVFPFLIASDLFGIILLERASQKYNAIQTDLRWIEEIKKQGIQSNILAQSKEVDKLFPDEQGVISFVTNISKAKTLFKDLSLTFKSEEPEGTRQKYLPFVLTISGNLKEISAFLEKTLNAPYVIEMKTVETANKEGSLSEGEITIKANLYVSDKFN